MVNATRQPWLRDAIRPPGTSTTWTRATAATALCADGSTLCTYAAGTPRCYADGTGCLIEGAATQYLFNNCSAPATQTTPSLGTGSYTGWMEGTGSVAFTVGTATATGLPCTATTGVANDCHFTVTVAGTVTATVTGSVTFEQLESVASITEPRTSKICAAGATATRNQDVPTNANPFGSVFEFPTCVAAVVNLPDWTKGFHPIWSINGSGANSIGLFRTGAASQTTLRDAAAQSHYVAITHAPAAGEHVYHSCFLGPLAMRMYFDYAQVGTETVAGTGIAAIGSVAWKIGGRDAGEAVNGVVRKFKVCRGVTNPQGCRP